MKGNCKHISCAVQVDGAPVVELSREDDVFYCTYFENWDELNDFIDELKRSGKTAWGRDFSDPMYDI